jgi:hexulose-6-phosphate isomerase
MLRDMRRRNFLHNLAGAGAAGLGLSSGVLAGSASAAGVSQAAPAGPLKKGVNIGCFPSRTPIREAMRKAKLAGFQGIELQFAGEGEVGLNSTPDDMRRLAEEAQRIGIEIAGVVGQGWNPSLTADDPAVREQCKTLFRKCLQLTAALGTDSVLVVPGSLRARTGPARMVPRYETAWERATQGIRELIPEAEKNKVCLSIENVWNNFLLSPLEMRSFIDQFNSPWVRAHLDLGNMLLYGYAQDWVLTLGPRIKRVHVKDFNGSRYAFVNLLEGDLDWPAAMAALREVGFRGHLIAELSPHPAAPDLLLDNTSKAMDYILAM